MTETHELRCQYCGAFRDRVGTICDSCQEHIVNMEKTIARLTEENEVLWEYWWYFDNGFPTGPVHRKLEPYKRARIERLGGLR